MRECGFADRVLRPRNTDTRHATAAVIYADATNRITFSKVNSKYPTQVVLINRDATNFCYAIINPAGTTEGARGTEIGTDPAVDGTGSFRRFPLLPRVPFPVVLAEKSSGGDVGISSITLKSDTAATEIYALAFYEGADEETQ